LLTASSPGFPMIGAEASRRALLGLVRRLPDALGVPLAFRVGGSEIARDAIERLLSGAER
jgi:hypothetical protein